MVYFASWLKFVLHSVHMLLMLNELFLMTDWDNNTEFFFFFILIILKESVTVLRTPVLRTLKTPNITDAICNLGLRSGKKFVASIWLSSCGYINSWESILSCSLMAAWSSFIYLATWHWEKKNCHLVILKYFKFNNLLKPIYYYLV